MDLENRNIMSYLCFCVELKQVLLLKLLESEFKFQFRRFAKVGKAMEVEFYSQGVNTGPG